VDKFKERLVMMRDLMAQYGSSGVQNPFVDEPKPVLVGEAYYSLEGLANLIDNPITLNLIGTTY
jgi:hypothetical protein